MSFTTDYNFYKVTTSLNAETIFISMMNLNTYNIYEKEISTMDFNNDKFTLKNLYNILEKGFNKDETIKITIGLHNKILKINFKILSELMNFNHSFELNEKSDDNIHIKELKKEIDSLKQKNSKLESIVNGNQESQKSIIENIINKNTKANSIIPIINIQIDEEEVERKYKWFLDYFLTQIEKNPNVKNIYEPYMLPNTTINGKNIGNDLEWNPITIHGNYHGQNAIIQCIPERKLYYYLKRRNIDIWLANDNPTIYWMYIH